MQNWIVLAAAILNLLFGLFVLLPNPKKPAYLTYFLFSLVASLWCLSVFVFAYLGFKDIMILRLQFALGALVTPAGIVWFDTIFSSKDQKTRKCIVILLGLVWAAISLIGDSVVKSIGPVITTDNGWFFHLFSYDFSFQNGSLTILYGIFIMAIGAYFMYRVILGLKKSTGIEHIQYRYVAFGLGGGIAIPIFSNVFFPLIYNVTSVIFADAISSLFFTSLAAVAIIKHRFMDIRLAAARSFVYMMLIVIFTLSYAGLAIVMESIFLGQQAAFDSRVDIIRFILAIVMAICFAPAKHWLNKLTDKIFYRDQFDSEWLLKFFSTEISKAIGLKETLEKVVEIISYNLKASALTILVVEDGHTVATKSSEKKMNGLEDNEIKKLMDRNFLNQDNLSDDDEVNKILKSHGIKLSLTLKAADDCCGLLLLGEKSSGSIYNSRDINALATLGPEVALNIESWLKVDKAMRKLEEANKNLKELDEAKTEFIALISHNLRTPLTLLQGYLSFLLELKNYKDKDTVAEYLRNMNIGASRLNSLIEDIILVTSIVGNKKKLIIKEFSPSELVDEVKYKYESEMKAKKIDFRAFLRLGAIQSDRELMKAVFNNLIENAVKFNKTGGSIIIKEQRTDDGKAIFNFVDTGIGIPSDKQNELFGKFNRETDIYRYDYEGLGLGLYTTRLILTLLGGEIWYESIEGGSSFFIKIPMGKNAGE